MFSFVFFIEYLMKPKRTKKHLMIIRSNKLALNRRKMIVIVTKINKITKIVMGRVGVGVLRDDDDIHVIGMKTAVITNPASFSLFTCLPIC